MVNDTVIINNNLLASNVFLPLHSSVIMYAKQLQLTTVIGASHQIPNMLQNIRNSNLKAKVINRGIINFVNKRDI